MFFWIDDWYSRYSYVMLKAFQNARPAISALKKNPDYQNSSSYAEQIYSCMIASIRFFEGVSWHYSPMLIHNRLEKEHSITLKVTLARILKIEHQINNEKFPIPVAKSQDIEACFVPEPVFQRASTLEEIDKIICSD